MATKSARGGPRRISWRAGHAPPSLREKARPKVPPAASFLPGRLLAFPGSCFATRFVLVQACPPPPMVSKRESGEAQARGGMHAERLRKPRPRSEEVKARLRR